MAKKTMKKETKKKTELVGLTGQQVADLIIERRLQYKERQAKTIAYSVMNMTKDDFEDLVNGINMALAWMKDEPQKQLEILKECESELFN